MTPSGRPPRKTQLDPSPPLVVVPRLKAGIRVYIRWLIRRDWAEVLEIERLSFEYPVEEEGLMAWLRQRNCIGMVAEYDERVVGFMVYELHKNHLHVLDFAVHPDYRRHAVGTQMVTKLLGKLSSHRRTQITFRIRETNLAGQCFWRAMEFRWEQTIHEHYGDTGEDAYVMEYRLPPGPTDEECEEW